MTGRAKVNRPLSPHLTIYKPQFTSVLSILHRITGIGLVLSLGLLLIWFTCLSLGPTAFRPINILFDTIFIKLILALSTWALWYHTCAGIRHLIWDLGYGLEAERINLSAYLVLLASLSLTLFSFYLWW